MKQPLVTTPAGARLCDEISSEPIAAAPVKLVEPNDGSQHAINRPGRSPGACVIDHDNIVSRLSSPGGEFGESTYVNLVPLDLTSGEERPKHFQIAGVGLDSVRGALDVCEEGEEFVNLSDW